MRTTETVSMGSSEWAKLRDEFVQAQAGQCPICLSTLDDPQLDHCHDSGFIRGALCLACNVRLGWYEKNRKGIESYLARAAEFTAHRMRPRSTRLEALRRYWQDK